MAETLCFVLGCPRSGSTVVASTLGALEGVEQVGEVENLWRVALSRPGYRCGCGLPVRDCPLWSQVLECLPRHALDPDRVEPRIAAVRRGRRPDLLFSATARALYGALSDLTGARVLVDASKSAGFAAAVMASLPEIDVVAVHCIRDPRGVVVSRHRGWRGNRGLTCPLDPRQALRTVLAWSRSNLRAERVRRHWGKDHSARLRYEAFVGSTADALGPVLDLLGVAALDNVSGATVRFPAQQHSVAGNPVRMSGEQLELEEDDAWCGFLGGGMQAALWSAGLPLTAIYGYPMRRAAAESPRRHGTTEVGRLDVSGAARRSRETRGTPPGDSNPEPAD